MAQFKRPISLHFTLIPYLNYQNGQFYQLSCFDTMEKNKFETRSTKFETNSKSKGSKSQTKKGSR